MEIPCRCGVVCPSRRQEQILHTHMCKDYVVASRHINPYCLPTRKGANRMSKQFTGKVEILDDVSDVTITLDGMRGDIKLGGNGTDGDVEVRNKDGEFTVCMVGKTGTLQCYDEDRKATIALSGQSGTINLLDGPGRPTIMINGRSGELRLGGHRQDGNVIVRNHAGMATIHLEGQSGRIVLGGNVQTVELRDGVISLGGNGTDGMVWLLDKDDDPMIVMGGESRRATFKSGDGRDAIYLEGRSGNITLGCYGQAGDLFVNNKNGQQTIHLDGEAGDIVLHNADCAEDFDVSESSEVEPGTVVVLDQEGELRQSMQAYDKRVAGVVSGAGDNRAGIVLDKKPEQTNRVPVALMGKVYCKVDAQYSPVEVGDPLTTSPTPGHAMKADDPLKAFGAVIGKAMCSLPSGRGLIPIIVALQ